MIFTPDPWLKISRGMLSTNRLIIRIPWRHSIDLTRLISVLTLGSTIYCKTYVLHSAMDSTVVFD